MSEGNARETREAPSRTSAVPPVERDLHAIAESKELRRATMGYELESLDRFAKENGLRMVVRDSCDLFAGIRGSSSTCFAQASSASTAARRTHHVRAQAKPNAFSAFL